jgi:hypothetical protein
MRTAERALEIVDDFPYIVAVAARVATMLIFWILNWCFFGFMQMEVEIAKKTVKF